MSEQDEDLSAVLHFKGGFDGASSQSLYKQQYTDTDLSEAVKNEASLFQNAIVPLKLTVNDETVWYNSKPSSTLFCRPVHLQYKKETKEVTKGEEERLRAEIENLEVCEVSIKSEDRDLNSILHCKYKLDLTMFDGKVVNVLTNTLSSQSCNICSAKPSEMNNLNLVRSKPVNKQALALGLSTLHCWIRCFEYIIHLGYKIETKSYYARTAEQKDSVARRKNIIQKRFREELSLLVDMPKQGFGNTNDGNTARRAFEHADIFSDITGVEVEVIIRLRTILRAVCSGYDLDSKPFQQYCQQTSDEILSNYDWYIIPPSVHKLLEHGVQVAEVLELPIGVYSEEAQEALNKEIRKARLNHSCKISRLNVMKNQYNYLLARSDPIISSISFGKHKTENGKPLPQSVLSLLKV